MKYKLPYSHIRHFKRIVIYGAGKVGMQFYRTLSKKHRFHVLGLVDKYSCKASDNEKKIKNLDWLLQQEYDIILIAILNPDIAYNAMLDLHNHGIPSEKMLWYNYQNYNPLRCPNRENLVYQSIVRNLKDNRTPEKHLLSGSNHQNCIWVCWLQGFDSAPLIVQKCHARLKEMSVTHTVVDITYENISDYIDIPDYILYKHEKGTISHAHFTDIIRLMLLAQYGGLWVDATCWFTDKVPEYYFQYPFFVFQYPIYFYDGMRLSSNWLIGSTPNNELILKWEQCLLDWWKTNDKTIDYYIMHYLLTYSVYHDLYTYKVWNMLPYFDNVTPHMLQHDYDKPFDAERYKYICSLTPVHKLTYKYTHIVENSVLSHLLYDE